MLAAPKSMRDAPTVMIGQEQQGDEHVVNIAELETW
jgi:hypothetical protein